ncbi:MAG: hypothetical protein U0324_41690 [Polyangiales bacterium]
MRPSAWTIAAALTLAGAGAGAQISTPVRTVGRNRAAVNAQAPLGRLDCDSREKITFQVNYPGDGNTFSSLQFWVGTQASSCMDMATRYPATNAVCWQIAGSTISGQQSMYSNNDFQIEARYLVDPLGGNCASPTTPSRGTINTNYLSLLVQTNSGLVMTGMSIGIPFDLDPPSTPASVTARPGEGSIEVAWTYSASTTSTTTDAATTTTDDATTSTTTSTTDLAGFWVVCDPPGAAAADAGADGGADAGADAGLDVPDNVLGADAGASCGADFPAIDLYNAAQFNRYARGGRTSATSTSLTVSGLANGVSYRCAVVAEDNAGNRTISAPSTCVTPVPVTDFWERYRSDGGGATIACAARPARPGARGSVAALATLSLAAAALAARRRRRS